MNIYLSRKKCNKGISRLIPNHMKLQWICFYMTFPAQDDQSMCLFFVSV